MGKLAFESMLSSYYYWNGAMLFLFLCTYSLTMKNFKITCDGPLGIVKYDVQLCAIPNNLSSPRMCGTKKAATPRHLWFRDDRIKRINESKNFAMYNIQVLDLSIHPGQRSTKLAIHEGFEEK